MLLKQLRSWVIQIKLGLGMHKLELSFNILNPHSSIKVAQITKYPWLTFPTNQALPAGIIWQISDRYWILLLSTEKHFLKLICNISFRTLPQYAPAHRALSPPPLPAPRRAATLPPSQEDLDVKSILLKRSWLRVWVPYSFDTLSYLKDHGLVTGYWLN